MFTQSTFTRKRVKPNRRASGKKTGNKRIGDLLRNTTAGKSVTDSHTPHYGTRKKTGKNKQQTIPLPSISPWKLILTSFLIGICGLLYITHVFSTQQLLEEVQQLETQFNRTSRIHSETRLAYDRMVGPKEIYKRAKEEGFVNAGPADRVIELK